MTWEKRRYDGHNRKPGKHRKLARHRFTRRFQRADRRFSLSNAGGATRYYLT